MKTTTLTKLAAPVPPMIEEALGYLDDSRFIVIHVDRAIGCVCCDDGRKNEDLNYDAWHILTASPVFAEALCAAGVGDVADPWSYFVVLDRRDRAFHVGAIDQVEAYLLESQKCRSSLKTGNNQTFAAIEGGDPVVLLRLDNWLGLHRPPSNR